MYTRRRFITSTGAATLTLLARAAATTAHIARTQNMTLTVSPATISIEGEPGDTGTQEILVRNDGEVEFAARALVAPYSEDDSLASAVPWITVEPDAISLAPGEEGVFTLQLNVPNDTASGSYLARVTFTTERDSPDGQTAIGVAGAVAISVAFVIQGKEDLVRNVQVGAVAPFLEPDGRVGFRAALVNDGNVHTRVPGRIEVLGTNGSPIAALDFPEQLVLPGQTVGVRATGTLPLPLDNDYTARATFTVGDDDDADELSTEVDFAYGIVEPALVQIAMCENLDRGPSLAMQLANPSTIGQIPQIRLQLQQENSSNAITATDLQGDIALWPGGEMEIMTDLPNRLETGRYVLVTDVSVGGGEPVATEYPFEIGGTSSETLPLCTLLNPAS